MDILSHGLWGGAAFGRRNKTSFWKAFLFGIMPDFLAFVPFLAGSWVGLFTYPHWASGSTPSPDAFPSFVYLGYSLTHSLIIFALVFLLVWIIRRKPLYEMFAWPLHIIFDIPLHSNDFFPTPFLWPLSDFHIDGISWAHPFVFLPNVILLILIYGYFFMYKKGWKKMSERSTNESSLWFRARNYDVIWRPVSWQGWMVTLVYFGIVILTALNLNTLSYSTSDFLISFSTPFIISSLIFLTICYVKGKRG